MRLVKWKRNEIIKALVAGGLAARDCTFDFGDSESRITHVPSESSFLLEGDAGHYTSTMTVGDGLPQPLQHYTWPTVPERLQRWAEEVKRDFDTPDLWAELQREREILTGARYEDVGNTPFTPEEQADIAEQLREIEEYVKKTYSLSTEQMSLVEARFNDLEAATSRIGRKDWLLMFLGVLFSLIASGLLPPEAVQHILGMAFDGLDHLLGGEVRPTEPPSPQIPPTT